MSGSRQSRRRWVAGAFLLAFLPGIARAQDGPRVLTLQQVTRLALERDPAAVAAEASISNASADVMQTRGSWLPNVNLNTTYSNSSNERFDQATGRLVSES